MFSRLLLAIGLITSITVQFGFAKSFENDECLYNIEAIGKPKFLQSPDFSKTEWNDTEKVARIVTKQKEKLVVRYSACENLGVEAELSMDANGKSMSKTYISCRMLWLANNILQSKEEVDTIKNVLRHAEFAEVFRGGVYNKKKLVLNVPSNRYMEMTLGVEIVKNRLVLSLVTVSF